MSDAPHWTEPGAYPVAEGIHRIPLPLPNDGLRAVNVYAVESLDRLTLIDGARELRRALEAGVEVVEAFVCEPLLAGVDARAALDLLRARGVATQPTSEAVFAKLAFGERAEPVVEDRYLRGVVDLPPAQHGPQPRHVRRRDRQRDG